MADPAVVDVRGVEVEIVLFRSTDNLLEATLTDAEGNPVDITTSSVTMAIADRPGGTQKYKQTNSPPSGHTDPGNGVTRFTVPRTVFDGLANRAYTWTYWIYRYAQGQRIAHFYGDVRVMVNPPAPEVAR